MCEARGKTSFGVLCKLYNRHDYTPGEWSVVLSDHGWTVEEWHDACWSYDKVQS